MAAVQARQAEAAHAQRGRDAAHSQSAALSIVGQLHC
jgi:hypothetical protein